MKDTASIHKDVQDICDCYATTDPLREMSVLDFAKIINTMTDNKAGFIFKSLPEDDPKVRQPDITKAKTKLGWEPKISMEKGLKKTLEYFRVMLKHNRI